MDPSVQQSINTGWALAAQRLSENAETDRRSLGTATAIAMLGANDPIQYAGFNVAARTPTTIEHVPYPGYTYPAPPAK